MLNQDVHLKKLNNKIEKTNKEALSYGQIFTNTLQTKSRNNN